MNVKEIKMYVETEIKAQSLLLKKLKEESDNFQRISDSDNFHRISTKAKISALEDVLEMIK